MKRSLLIILVAAPYLLQAQVQEERVEKLQARLQASTQEREKIGLLGELSYAYLWTNSDSSIHYAQEELSRSLKAGLRAEQLYAYKNMSNALSVQSVYRSALQYTLEAMRIAEELDKDSLYKDIYGALGVLYSEMGNQQEAILYLHKAAGLCQKLRDSITLCHNLVNLGIMYLDAGQLDSALHYTQQAYARALEIKDWDYDMMGAIFLNTGIIEYQMHNKEIAMAYYRKALASAHYYSDWVDVTDIHKSIGDLFWEEGKKDSSKRNYEIALQTADRIKYNKLKIELAEKLAGLYKDVNKDSTLKYLALQMNLKDSLFNEQRIRAEQDIIFRERLYQEKQQAESVRLSNERRTNLQLLAISVFIIGFFSVLIMLSRINIRPAYVEWMGIIALLMLFEFIALLIHPLLEKWTGHSPVFMLLILMLIAAGMGPLHHKVKNRVLTRLARKG